MSDESMSKETERKRVSIDEPTASKNDKKINLQAGTFLRNKHPELFEIQPRRGGFRRPKANRQDAYYSTVNSEATQTQISSPSTSKLRARDHATIEEVLETNIRCPSAQSFAPKDQRTNNKVRICSAAVSTVMMLAQRAYEDITTEHIRHTVEYFRGLKQSSGYPANVGQLMRLLTNLKSSENIALPVTEEEDEGEKEKEKEEEHSEAEMSDQIS